MLYLSTNGLFIWQWFRLSRWTPSDEVDQAWHLHMLYTDSYWRGLCEGVLGRELSHGPTKGGEAEGEKFTDWYGKTKELYRTEFGEEPPVEVWPSSAVRFGLAPHFVRVNTAENFVVSKSAVRQFGLAGTLVLGLVVLVGCSYSVAQVSAGEEAEAFLLIGGIVLVVAIVVAGLILFNKNRGGGGGNGGSGGHGSGCGGTYHSSDGDSGCSSGCSGCGGGCGGCGS